jgi:hypothetical protein
MRNRWRRSHKRLNLRARPKHERRKYSALPARRSKSSWSHFYSSFSRSQWCLHSRFSPGGDDSATGRPLVQAAPDVVIKAGRSVCTMLDGGYGTRAVTGMLNDRLALNSDYDAMVVGISALR